MSELKITKGEFYVVKGECDMPVVNFNHDKAWITFSPSVSSFGGYDALGEVAAMADIFVEAGNITKQTGLTPKQLLEQRGQLLDVLRQIASHDGKVTADTARDMNWLAQEAIARVEVKP